MTKPKWIGLFLASFALAAFSENEGNVHVDIRNAPIGDAIRLLAKAKGVNVIVPDKLNERINASFPSVQISEALSAVLDSNQLGGLVEGNVVKVTNKKAIEDKGQDLRIVNFPLKFAKAEDVAPQVKVLVSQRGTVMFDKRTNSVTVRDTQADLASVAGFLEKIDHPDRQVLIEARIVEATTNFRQALGVQWGTSATGPTYTVGGVSSIKPPLDTGRQAMLGAPIPGPLAGVGFSVSPINNLFIDAQITAAEENGDLAILSRPYTVAANNRAATIHSGVKFYVKTASSLTLSSGSSSGAASGSASGGSSGSAGSGAAGSAGGAAGGATAGVQEINSGITLIVTPQITGDNKITLTINVTESQADFGNGVDGIPSIIDNTAETTVTLENGATTVIGGLFQKNVSSQENGIPFLQRIPILGALFGSKEKKDIKKELIIFLKPTLIADGEKPAIQEESDKRFKEIQKIADPENKS